jgi:hypothetical protein
LSEFRGARRIAIIENVGNLHVNALFGLAVRHADPIEISPNSAVFGDFIGLTRLSARF